MSEDIIKIECFEHIYPDKTRIELCGLEFCVKKGEKTAILGPNGSGKTTLIRHILGLLTPSKGDVRVFNVDPSKEYKKIRKKIGVVLQNVEEQLIGPTVLDDIMFSPVNFGFSEVKAAEMAVDIMKKLNIIDLKDKVIHYLSGGEKRKVALAGAMVMSPELLVLDEPFSNLDKKSEIEFISLINSFCKEKEISVVISTHDIEFIAEFIDKVYLISKNRISKKGTPREILYLKDEISEYNLQEPSLVKVFSRLKDDGIDIGSPISANEAYDILKENFIFKNT